jgi:hypothetical protein
MNRFLTAIGLSAAIFLVGCSGEYSGGGVMDSASGIPGEKATFGFTVYASNDGVSCDEITTVKGQFQFVDKSAGVTFHAEVHSFAGGYADDDFNVAPLFLGGYYIKGKKQGSVLLAAIDYGPDSKTDTFFVTVLDGPYAGYVNSGVFTKGNVTYTPDPLCH